MQRYEHWLNTWAKAQNYDFTFNENVCALVDKENVESAVIEVPPHSPVIILHATLRDWPVNSPVPVENLLAMNFEMNAMRGCWLAFDKTNMLRLCTQREIETLNQVRFTEWLEGFIELVGDVRGFIYELFEMAKLY